MSIFCKKCSRKESLHELDLDTAARLVEWRLCQQCLYWKSIILMKSNPLHMYRIFIINNICYLIKNILNKCDKKFVIRFKDGKQITIYNFIRLGSVPRRWRNLLCNNARIINRK